jgi:hypothetical protein
MGTYGSTESKRRRGTSYHFGPALMILTSLSLKALVSAGIEDEANKDAFNVISLLRAILKAIVPVQE